MSKAGLPDSVLIAKINSSFCEFDTTVARLKELKGSGVPDAVLLAMVEYLPNQPKALGATGVNPVTSSAHQLPATDNSPAGKVLTISAMLAGIARVAAGPYRG